MIEAKAAATKKGVSLRGDYIEANWADSLDPVERIDLDADVGPDGGGNGMVVKRPIILSGAMWLGRTRLIDNLILGDLEDGKGSAK